MQNEIRMPLLPGREEGWLARWHVREGQSISAGDVIAEIETATSTLELEAASAGRIERILVHAGSRIVEPSTPLAVVAPAQAATMPDRAPEPQEQKQSPAAPRSSPDTPATIETTASSASTLREAVRDALSNALSKDPSVFVIGPGVAQNSGERGITQGLVDIYGAARVVSVPALDQAVAGLAIGAAFAGLRPVVVLPSWPVGAGTLDQIAGTAIEHSRASGGQLTAPVLFLFCGGPVPGGDTIAAPEPAAALSQIAGLTVAAPATPACAGALIAAALTGRSPVALHIDPQLADRDKSPNPPETPPSQAGRARIVRPGRDLTLVTFGRGLSCALEAAEALQRDGHAVEVIDLVTLAPADTATFLASVSKTGRLLVAAPNGPADPVTAGLIAAVSSQGFSSLKAAPGAVRGDDVAAVLAAARALVEGR